MAQIEMRPIKRVRAIVEVAQCVVSMIDAFEVVLLRLSTFGFFVYELIRIIGRL